MGLSEISVIFSRFFIVGFFLPAYFALVALGWTLTENFLPSLYTDYEPATRLLILAGLALPIGLVLLGLRYPIVRFFEGYPFLWAKPLRWLQEKSYDRLEARKRLARPDAPRAAQQRGLRAWQALDRRFPPRRNDLLPTRLGNAIRAWERYANNRWGLDTIAVWPRIDPLLTEREQALHETAQTDMYFFLNSTIAALVAGAALLVNAISDTPVDGIALAAYAAPFALGYTLYRGAITAAVNWGVEVRASIDLHRLELYEKLGFRKPSSFRDERLTVAPALSRFLIYGEPVPQDSLWRGDDEPSRANRGGGGVQ